uniref:GAR domain-containing protein n=1 Tax=Timema cristinae TaxID=61476 RepID=A0A7R9CZ41_TIMCR|nr:unnamed protein product [Timema cristinae]
MRDFLNEQKKLSLNSRTPLTDIQQLLMVTWWSRGKVLDFCSGVRSSILGPGTDLSDYQTLPSPLTRHLRPPPPLNTLNLGIFRGAVGGRLVTRPLDPVTSPVEPLYDTGSVILRKHVMVRVGGGWDTLSHYLDKHDPCRCKTAHRSPINAKLVLKSGGANMDLGSAHVYYDRSPPRTRRSSASSVGSTGGGGNVNMASLIPAPSQAGGGGSRNRSRSRSPSHAPALRPPSFRSSTHCLVQEPSATPTDTPLNDSSSEVSDEGYRSLGPLVMTPQSSTHISDVNTPLNTNANNLGIPKDERVHWESSTLDYKVTDASRKA